MNVTRNLYSFWRKNNFLIICSFIVFSLTTYHRLDNVNFWQLPKYIPCDAEPYLNNPSRFEGIVGRDANVPDVIHLIRFGRDAICFTQGDLDSFLSIFETFTPHKIYIHTDDVDSLRTIISKIFTRNYIREIIEVKYYPAPKHIFGLNFSETFRLKHMIDFTKLKILRRHGGIFLGNNIHVVQDPRQFLEFEMTIVVRSTLNIDSPLELFDDVVIAHKDARFLEAWLKSYHQYDVNEVNHVEGKIMRNFLKKNTMYVHILENDLSKRVILRSNEYKALLSSRKRYFVTIKNKNITCIDYEIDTETIFGD